MKHTPINKSVIFELPLSSGTPDAAKVSELLRETGLSPYVFIRSGFKYLVNSNYAEARKCMDYAMEFRGLFFKAGSPEDREYCVEMQLLNAAFLFLTEKFRPLPADIETGELKKMP